MWNDKRACEQSFISCRMKDLVKMILSDTSLLSLSNIHISVPMWLYEQADLMAEIFECVMVDWGLVAAAKETS
jgi:hypothetical protein